MKHLDRYILSEMLLPFFSGVLLIVVMLVGNTLYPLIETIFKNHIPFMVIAKMVVFNIPTLLVLTIPAGVALSAAWTINRLARDSEITCIRMAGVPLRRLFLPIWAVGLAASLASFFVADQVVPRAQRQFRQTESQMIAYALQSSPSVAQDKVFNYQNYFFYISRVEKDPGGDPNKLRLTGVSIYERPPAGGYPTLTTAASATYNKDIWELSGVTVHTIGPDGFVTAEVSGKTTTLNLRVPLDNLAASDFQRPDELTMAQLGAQMRALAKLGQDNTVIAVNYYSKLALPFVCLAFALCAPPLAMRFARSGSYSGIFVSLVMVWVAWNTLLLTKYLGLAGAIPPMLAAWTPDLLLAAVGLGLLLRMD